MKEETRKKRQAYEKELEKIRAEDRKKKPAKPTFDLGRPTKYEPRFCKMLVEHMEQGYSYLSFAGTVSVHTDTLYEWEKNNPDFSVAKKIGLSKNLQWWEKQGMKGLWHGGGNNQQFNSAVWIFNLKNRHGWRDKIEEVQTQEKPIVLGYDPKKKLADSNDDN